MLGIPNSLATSNAARLHNGSLLALDESAKAFCRPATAEEKTGEKLNIMVTHDLTVNKARRSAILRHTSL